MMFFRFHPGTEPNLPKTFLNHNAVIIRGTPDEKMGMLVVGMLNELSIRRNPIRGGTMYEVSLKIANGWQQLAEGDDVFLYDRDDLDADERSAIMDALSWIITGHKGPEERELQATVASIQDAFRRS